MEAETATGISDLGGGKNGGSLKIRSWNGGEFYVVGGLEILDLT